MAPFRKKDFNLRPLARLKQGFTLVELLTVIAIIGVLAAIVVGIAGAVGNQQSEARARADMVAISLALETFKKTYGDYPWLGAETEGRDLYRVLAGELQLQRSPSGAVNMVTTSGRDEPLMDLDSMDVQGNVLMDPWGNPYQYFYRAGGVQGSVYAQANYDSWPYKRTSFLLMSKGEDGLSDDSALVTGQLPANLIDYFSDDNTDNLVHNVEF
jgi:prepilin-type N-terminal cleavage/methylation domain-containing protein